MLKFPGSNFVSCSQAKGKMLSGVGMVPTRCLSMILRSILIRYRLKWYTEFGSEDIGLTRQTVQNGTIKNP